MIARCLQPNKRLTMALQLTATGGCERHAGCSPQSPPRSRRAARTRPPRSLSLGSFGDFAHLLSRSYTNKTRPNKMKKANTIALSFALAVALVAVSPSATAAETESPVVAAPVATANPSGVWAWHNNSKTVFINADRTIGKERKEGVWQWIDETKRTLQINWAEGWVDKLTIAEDGKTMAVVNNAGTRYTVRRLPPTNDYEAPSIK